MQAGTNNIIADKPKAPSQIASSTTFRILFAVSLVHLCNDMMQSVIPAMFPILKSELDLSYRQVGFIFFIFQLTASIMQPVVGIFTDRRPFPALLPLGMISSLIGIILLAFAPSYVLILFAVIFIGLGSAAFHPEGSRVAHLAAGGRKGMAQSIFQVGGNTGAAMGPIITKWVLLPLGQIGAIWFTIIAGIGIFIQMYVAKWYGGVLKAGERKKKAAVKRVISPERKQAIVFAMVVLLFLVLFRSWYSAAVSTYYAFYLNEIFGVSIENAQMYLFVYLVAGAVGTFVGGPLADRFGKRNIIFFSMLGAAPLSIAVPYVDGPWLVVLLALNGMIMMSSFSVTVIYAQALVPGKIGMVSGLVTGLAFGLGGVGALAIGDMIETFGISPIMKLAGYLPLLGMLTFLLPSDRKLASWTEDAQG
ncbi:MFS transporter [Paenibacillus sp. N1-5-1-14]|uniref:MFS transporter n=1 Tax=Paenibacillus radicibacter TaxID=2972488 RepID=UPI002158DEF8|nr:MFS transporter [Paenibacillus radicibacter]MCR8645206.1 MFS transporter [Paenibacillus radicibacter]